MAFLKLFCLYLFKTFVISELVQKSAWYNIISNQGILEDMFFTYILKTRDVITDTRNISINEDLQNLNILRIYISLNLWVDNYIIY